MFIYYIKLHVIEYICIFPNITWQIHMMLLVHLNVCFQGWPLGTGTTNECTLPREGPLLLIPTFLSCLWFFV